MFEERPKAALLGRRDTVQFWPAGVPIFAGIQIAGLLDPFSGRAVESIEAALALAARVAGGDHFFDHRRIPVDGVERVVLGQGAGEAGQNMRHEVEPHHVEEPEDTGLGDSHGAADHRIRLLDGDLIVDRRDDRVLQPVGADAVGDEARRVFAVDDRLAETQVGERAHPIRRPGRRLRPDDELQQAHIAGRIEEVGDQEVALQARRHAVGQGGKRYGGGVRRDDGAVLADGVDLGIEVAFDVDPFDHRLDDPIAVGQAIQVILDIARRDALGVASVHKGGGIGL